MAPSYPGIVRVGIDLPGEHANTMQMLLIGLGVLIFIGIIILIVRATGKRNKGESLSTQADASVNGINRHRDSIESYAKRCPTCQSTYTDETLAFCLSDGSTLERIANTFALNDPNATLAYREAATNEVPPTVQYHPDLSPNKKG
jgi:hypothetical protein